VASSDVKQPYVIKDEKGSPLFAFDTTGEITEPTRNGPILLMTRTELIQMDAAGNIQRHALSQFPDTVITREWIMSWAYTLRNVLIPGGLLLCGGGTFALRLLGGLLLAAIGLALNSAFHGGLQFQALLRLALVSMTGPVLLETILSLVGVNTACWGFFVTSLLSLGYMAFAVKAATAVVPQGFPISPDSQRPPPLPGQPPQKPADFDERFP